MFVFLGHSVVINLNNAMYLDQSHQAGPTHDIYQVTQDMQRCFQLPVLFAREMHSFIQ